MSQAEYTTRRELAVVDAAASETPAVSAVSASQGFLMPLDTAESARRAIAAYEQLKQAIIQTSDLQKISGKMHIKKSGWLRIARAFGLTVEPLREEYTVDADGSWGYAIVVRAVAPNGASMQGDGMCWSTEKPAAQRTRHNVRAHAYTRATNRAISNLVGGGEVSAEEIMGDITDEDAPVAPTSVKAERDLIGLALSKVDIQQALNKLGVRGREAQRTKLAEIRATLEAVHKPFNGENTLAELERQYANAFPLEALDTGEMPN